MSQQSIEDQAALQALLGKEALAQARPLWRRPSVWGLLCALGVGIAAVVWWQGDQGSRAAPVYVTETVGRGDLRLTIRATGTLRPTRTIEIGSELSGTVNRVLADVNDRVAAGQVLVELDPTALQDQADRQRASLLSAEAQLVQAEATTREARTTLGRLREVWRLSDGRVPSQTELDTAATTLARAEAGETVAQAAIAEARAQLASTETSLSKTLIRSPIDGMVLSRAVEPGNAVAASLQAVTLLTLAEDLTRLRLEVDVDEADIGRISEGLEATFTVSAWPNRSYPAQVTRVNFGATTTDSVVSYTTLLEVDNDDLSLRPGMSASALITAAERRDVVLVPNMALRFTLPEESAGEAASGSSGNLLASLTARPRFPVSTTSSRRSNGDSRQVWVLDQGQPRAVPVQTGLSDGRMTEVLGGEIAEGVAVIVDQRDGGVR